MIVLKLYCGVICIQFIESPRAGGKCAKEDFLHEQFIGFKRFIGA